MGIGPFSELQWRLDNAGDRRDFAFNWQLEITTNVSVLRKAR
jgi:hypothetical protein